MDKVLMGSAKAKEMLGRLDRAVAAHKEAMRHLELAVSETEASRQALHDVGLQCWVDKMDHERGGH